MITYEQALSLIKEMNIKLESEEVSIDKLDGRVLSEKITARIPSPLFTNSAMDGFGVVHSDLDDKPLHILGTVFAKANPHIPDYTPRGCVKIMTGAMAPDWIDTVVPVEITSLTQDGDVTINEQPKKGAHIRHAGEDVEAGSLIFLAGTQLTPEKLSILASFGHAKANVWKKPEVYILTTGDELLEPGEPLQPGTIYNSSKFFLSSAFSAIGLAPISIKTLSDQPKQACDHIAKILISSKNSKIIVTTGAVSAGEKDYIPTLAKDMGFTPIFHKSMIRPGKPNFLAQKDDTIWLGLAGNAISTMVGFHFFAKPILESVWRITNPKMQELTLAEDFNKPERLRCFFRGKRQDNSSVVIHKNQGSSHLLATITADCFVELPEGQSIVRAGTKLKVLSLS